jgi:hypothetical protein
MAEINNNLSVMVNFLNIEILIYYFTKIEKKKVYFKIFLKSKINLKVLKNTYLTYLYYTAVIRHSPQAFIKTSLLARITR